MIKTVMDLKTERLVEVIRFVYNYYDIEYFIKAVSLVGGELYIQSGNGTMHVPIGSYIIKESPGFFVVVSPFDFINNYTSADSGMLVKDHEFFVDAKEMHKRMADAIEALEQKTKNSRKELGYLDDMIDVHDDAIYDHKMVFIALNKELIYIKIAISVLWLVFFSYWVYRVL